MTHHVDVFPDGRLVCGPLTARAVLGRSGVVAEKREGDGGTPAGRHPLRRVFYRPDRRAPPITGLPVAALAPDDGWCDDPADPAYNRPVKLPFAASHEMLWRDDPLYDLILVVGHNDAPPRPGLGSAIFVHLQRPDRGPTAGCVALEAGDLDRLLALLGPDSELVVHPA